MRAHQRPAVFLGLERPRNALRVSIWSRSDACSSVPRGSRLDPEVGAGAAPKHMHTGTIPQTAALFARTARRTTAWRLDDIVSVRLHHRWDADDEDRPEPDLTDPATAAALARAARGVRMVKADPPGPARPPRDRPASARAAPSGGLTCRRRPRIVRRDVSGPQASSVARQPQARLAEVSVPAARALPLGPSTELRSARYRRQLHASTSGTRFTRAARRHAVAAL